MEETNNKFHLSKWKLQSVAADVLGDGWGTTSCMRGQLNGSTCVHVNRKTGKAHYSGLSTCKSVWVCPVCSIRIASERREEIQKAFASEEGKKLIPVLVTFTLQHSLKDKMATLLKDLKDAKRYVLNGWFRKKFNKQFDAAGYINSVETRWSNKTGWHPHIHEIIMIRSPQNPEDIKAFLMSRYGKFLAEKGYLVNNHTIDVRGGGIDAQETVSDYLTKSSIELELTSGHWKQGASISPFQLLSAYHETGEKRFAALYSEYAEATRGMHWSQWSKGLKDLLIDDKEDDEEKTEDEIGEEQTEGEIVAKLDREEWWRVCRRRLRGELLIRAKYGGVGEWLIRKGIRKKAK